MEGKAVLNVSESGLLSADFVRGVNLFLGAGFSTLAKNRFTKSLPVGDGLKDLLVKEFNLEPYASLDLAGLYAVLLADRRDALRDFLAKTFTVTDYDSRYDALRSLEVEFLYTTNIDDLPFKIFDARGGDDKRVLHDLTLYGAPRQPSEVVQFIPLHGNVRHEDSDFLFTPGQIASAFASDRQTWYVFQRELQARPTFFLGYGMRDAGVLQALQDGSSRSLVNRWILLRRHDEAASALYTSLGFHVIVGEAEDFLKFVADRTNPVTPAVVRSGRQIFTGQVPNIAEVAQRPIRNFFLGAEPEWSDAYSSQVVRRRINSAVKNSIFNGKHVAIVGLPLSGKTTILKQVAAELAADRPILYFDRITNPQADKIVAEHHGQAGKALIFVDNLIDSRDPIDLLVNKIGAQIVCAEQSIYFDSVGLRSMQARLDVHSSSDILIQDLQRIIDSIPVDIRRWHPDEIDMVEYDSSELGLFESFRRHVMDENLTSRFRSKLAEFEAKDSEAFDVYIMACYVAACRTIVSFDMIYTYLPKHRKEYGDVYDVIRRIDSFLVEVDLANDSDQDHFSVRSGALARVALRECSSRSFGRIFERFHTSVSTRLIVDYPVFRRYAYDNDFARKAFPRVEDGQRFYERLVRSTDNAYDYQHGAIYLSKMKSFTEAFSWIDTALSKSRGRVFSIRNTHARILFEANIDVLKRNVRDNTALQGIKESMDVLQGCIKNDARRSYHLLRYSDQAIQYAEIMSDQNSLDWLRHAYENLQQMVDQATVSQSRESYNLRKYRKLYSEVRLALISRKALS
ncbi:SIR2 family protein [Belnapia sp. T6]|uniref:SIR2 family protein n=1 Tax=Belnapia mucosa TaxID=2804532 RepID=A0ABS1V7W6_9PROT|nr:SIR2 family protein [Belnapia mucosa]MBL6457757.1 SIR2 family protein [Belnapia mucosa]